MARRTGVPSLMKVAREMCRLITKFSPVIAQYFPGSTGVQAALAAANAACAALHDALMEIQEEGV